MRCLALTVFVFIFTASVAFASTTLSTGQTIVTQTLAPIDTKTLKTGDTIPLKVVPPYPAGASGLAGATITLTITDLTHDPVSGRARMAFLFDSIRFANGRSEPIAAYVQSSAVVRRGAPTPVAAAPPAPPSLTMPNAAPASTIFWSKKVGSSSSTSNNTGVIGPTGGYAYARSGDASLPAGSTVKIQLARDLAVPG